MTLARIVRPLAAALLVLSLLPSTSSAQAGRYDSFYVFGDSLADIGNVWLTSKALRVNPAPPPSESPNLTYFNGRFSNGPVAFEYLWQQLSGRAPGTSGALVPYMAAPLVKSPGAVNFAFGGTGTPVLDQTPGGLYAPGLLGQVELFRLSLQGKKPSKKALYAIVTGANDYRDDAFNEPMDPREVTANIGKAVERLYAIGARDILVLTLPNLGCLPYVPPYINAEMQPESECIAPAPPTVPGAPLRPSQLTAVHNAALVGTLNQLKASGRLSGATVRVVDVNRVFDGLRTAIGDAPQGPVGVPLWSLPALDIYLPLLPVPPTAAGPVPGSACLFVTPALCTDVPAFSLGPNAVIDPALPGFELLFWDVVHPTTFAHRQLATALYAALAQ